MSEHVWKFNYYNLVDNIVSIIWKLQEHSFGCDTLEKIMSFIAYCRTYRIIWEIFKGEKGWIFLNNCYIFTYTCPYGSRVGALDRLHPVEHIFDPYWTGGKPGPRRGRPVPTFLKNQNKFFCNLEKLKKTWL